MTGAIPRSVSVLPATSSLFLDKQVHQLICDYKVLDSSNSSLGILVQHYPKRVCTCPTEVREVKKKIQKTSPQQRWKTSPQQRCLQSSQRKEDRKKSASDAEKCLRRASAIDQHKRQRCGRIDKTPRSTVRRGTNVSNLTEHRGNL